MDFFKEISKTLTKILKENEKINGIVKDIINKLTTEVELSKKESPVKKNKKIIYSNIIIRMSLKQLPKRTI